MRKQNERIGIRLSKTQREQALSLVEAGAYKNLSNVIRVALKEFLDKNA